ncbi:DUF1349 domain-containing protein, partial [Rhizobium leguminosarum]|uniref:DUF1349 domain-containing protein n=1 Tax=Rhizobium leguminosarum TaxID=384 RepID=UPI001FEEE4F1
RYSWRPSRIGNKPQNTANSMGRKRRLQSDWSVAQPFKELEDFRIRVTVANGAMRIQASRDGSRWPLLRLAPFPAAAHYEVGPAACTPERSGLSVRFSEFSIGAAITTELHDLS